MMEQEATMHFAGSSGSTMHVPWRGLVTSMLSVALLCVFTFAAQTAKADSITFQDTTSDNIVNVSGTTRLATVAGCGTAAEICSITLAAPTGSTFSTSTLPPIIYVGEGNGHISDELIFAVSPDSKFVTLTFVSDAEGGSGLGTCPTTPACISETGLSQLAGNIVWSNDTTDSIHFASDPPEGVVPEPTSLLLLGSGLTIIGGFLRRRG
jgi:hypothetical protein